MSHIAVAHLFLGEFTPVTSGVITRCLRETGSQLTETRKGRAWILSTGDDTELTLTVRKTVDAIIDVDNDLARLEIEVDDFPECISIVSSLGRPDDLTNCCRICETLTRTLECKTIGAELDS